MKFVAVSVFLIAAGCARSPSHDVASAASSASAAPPVSSVAPGGGSGSSGNASADVPAAGASASASGAAAAAPDAPLEGLEFIAQARVLFRVAACGSGEVPARFDATVVSKHCDELSHAADDYRRAWVDVAKPVLAALRPRDLPRVVVYPFGGGDLASALATFPDATEITTISLEPAGDIRPVDTLPPDLLAHELGVHRSHLERLYEKAHSRTDNLEKEAKTQLPGEILFDLAALVVHGDEPVSLRYFRLGADGKPVYLAQADLDAATKKNADKRALFENAELRFRPAGHPDAPAQVLRHVSFNLDDWHLRADPSLLAYLNGRPKVAAMTKAASHLLWNDHFALIRNWLADHTDWMVSDSTGIPPRYAKPAGFVQDTFGKFDGPAPFGLLDTQDADDFVKLFAANPQHDLAFRYGYPDKDGNAHLVVTRKPPR
jgi:hypothetical protein